MCVARKLRNFDKKTKETSLRPPRETCDGVIYELEKERQADGGGKLTGIVAVSLSCAACDC